nr:MAG TPA: hypothetical protein [Bacteriophage sp.]
MLWFYCTLFSLQRLLASTPNSLLISYSFCTLFGLLLYVIIAVKGGVFGVRIISYPQTP